MSALVCAAAIPLLSRSVIGSLSDECGGMRRLQRGKVARMVVAGSSLSVGFIAFIGGIGLNSFV